MKIQDLKELSVKKLENYKNIYLLNGYSTEREHSQLYSYYRCTSEVQFIENCKQNAVFFSSPLNWKDKFERRFFRTDYTCLGFSQKKVRIQCFSSCPFVNEEAAWKVYSYNNENTIRLRMNTESFFKALDSFAEENDAEIYIGEAIYGLDVDEINNIHKQNEKYHEIFFSGTFGVVNYLSLMLLKRNAYYYENEVRFFIYLKNEADTYKEGADNFLKIPVTHISDIVTSISLGPDCKDKDNIKKELQKYIKDTKITCSRLYESGEELKKVTPDQL